MKFLNLLLFFAAYLSGSSALRCYTCEDCDESMVLTEMMVCGVPTWSGVPAEQPVETVNVAGSQTPIAVPAPGAAPGATVTQIGAGTATGTGTGTSTGTAPAAGTGTGLAPAAGGTGTGLAPAPATGTGLASAAGGTGTGLAPAANNNTSKPSAKPPAAAGGSSASSDDDDDDDDEDDSDDSAAPAAGANKPRPTVGIMPAQTSTATSSSNNNKPGGGASGSSSSNTEEDGSEDEDDDDDDDYGDDRRKLGRQRQAELPNETAVCYTTRLSINDTVITNRGCVMVINDNRSEACGSIYEGWNVVGCQLCESNGCNAPIEAMGGLWSASARSCVALHWLLVCLVGGISYAFV